MPDNESSDGIISKSELEELSSLFDRFEFALDPMSADCKLAESQFQDLVQSLYESKVRSS
jgi:hypothetical protein